ncbi:MAG: hypothetical protein WCK05_14955, partial [Planctomycetota bacterium]
LDGTIATADMADGAVTSAKILDGTIATADIADGAVTTGKILDGTIATADMADGAVTSAKILDGTIATADIADGAVTTGKILDGTIATADMADGAVTAAKLNDTITMPATKLFDFSGVGDVVGKGLKIQTVAGADPVNTTQAGQLVVRTDTGDVFVGTGAGAPVGVGKTKVHDHSNPASGGNIPYTSVTGNGVATNVWHGNGTFGQVVTGDIGDNQVTLAKLADNSVSSAKIIDENVTGAKLEKTITFRVDQLLDMSSVVTNAANKGIILPNSAGAPTLTKTDGQLVWDNLGKGLYVGDGTNPVKIASVAYVDAKVGDYLKRADPLSEIAADGTEATARGHLGLGTAALNATGDFDAAGVAAGLVATEAGTRATNDGTLQTNINGKENTGVAAGLVATEAGTRATNDGTLQTNINAKENTGVAAGLDATHAALKTHFDAGTAAAASLDRQLIINEKVAGFPDTQGGLLIKGNSPANQWGNMAFSCFNGAADIKIATISGKIIDNGVGTEAGGVSIATKASGGAITERAYIDSTGVAVTGAVSSSGTTTSGGLITGNAGAILNNAGLTVNHVDGISSEGRIVVNQGAFGGTTGGVLIKGGKTSAPANLLANWGGLAFGLTNDAAALKIMGAVTGEIKDAAAGTEEGDVTISTMTAGALAERLRVKGTGAAVTGQLTASAGAAITGAVSST